MLCHRQHSQTQVTRRDGLAATWLQHARAALAAVSTNLGNFIMNDTRNVPVPPSWFAVH
jgi:hypothetical protein